jgi:hypothetical protein
MRAIAYETGHTDYKKLSFDTLNDFMAWFKKQDEEVIIMAHPPSFFYDPHRLYDVYLEIYSDYRE